MTAHGSGIKCSAISAFVFKSDFIHSYTALDCLKLNSGETPWYVDCAVHLIFLFAACLFQLQKIYT